MSFLKGKNRVKLLGITLVMLLAFVTLMGGQAFAAPSDTIDVYMGTTWVGEITADQIEDASGEYLYSTNNNRDEIRYYQAKGALLMPLLINAGATVGSGDTLTFSDGSFTRTISYNDLYAARNYYPCGSGSPSPIGVILATENTPPSTSCTSFSPLNTTNAIRLFFGQTNALDKNAPNMVSNITSIVIN